ncbi:hepatocyte growth factor-regulated tyrosine kinase substrate-like isoform X2 [Tachypleus tridentatus]|uniref:hepatocyte growth factor-regulated tyrosine kinase substrate-like isoform X2 n=1 Tax=Tachypleus tridentatus TaxID=6853 RepID=UPI003FD2E530
MSSKLPRDSSNLRPKYALNAMKKKLYAQNPHVALYDLQVLESCVKNCGAPFHQEITSRSFMEELRELIKITTNENVKNKILELIQTWAHAFRNEPSYRAVQDTVNLMKMEGFKFPALKESDAMFDADTAPEWADGDCCHRCRVQFTVVQRKHHCRNCGQIFCGKCSSRTSAIPRFGIEKEVRVCEACWEKLNKSTCSPSQNSNSEHSSPRTSTGNEKSEEELQEEEELQLAIALSKSEAESKGKGKAKVTSTTKSKQSNQPYSYGDPRSLENKNKDSLGGLDQDTELARYLNRAYWEQRHEERMPRTTPLPSAPASVSTTQGSVPFSSPKHTEKLQNGEVGELDDFQNTLRTTLELFFNRMKSDSSRGRHIANDTYVQSLFMNITNMHAQLLQHIQEQDNLRARYESLQDKLGQIRDARGALDALREDHREKLRLEAEEAERQRQFQMAQKLEIMRKKKQEYLQFQREIAMQRMQEQEREMHMRQEHQKQQYQTMIHGPPGIYQVPYLPAPGYPVHQSADGSPGHIQYPGQYGQPPMGSGQQPVYPPFSIQSMPGSKVHPYSVPRTVLPTPGTVSQSTPPTSLGSLSARLRGPTPHVLHVPPTIPNSTMPQQLQGVSTASVMGTHQIALPPEQPAEAELISFD